MAGLKLFVEGFQSTQSYTEISNICKTYGRFFRMDRPSGKTYVFLEYETKAGADQAKAKFEKAKVNCQFADAQNSQRGRPLVFQSDSSNAVRNSKAFVNENEKTNIQLDNMFQADSNIIIKCIDGTNVYALPAEPAFSTRYAVFMNILSIRGEDADSLVRPIKQGTWASASYKGRYSRVIITSHVKEADEYAPVYFVDIGLHTSIAIEQLKILQRPYKDKSFVQKFQLRGVGGEKALLQDAADYLESFVDKTVHILTIERNGQPAHSIEITDLQTTQNINQIANHLNVKFKADRLAVKPPSLGYDKPLYIVDGTLLKNGDNLLALIDKKDRLTWEAHEHQIQASGKSVDAYPKCHAEPDELGIVKIDQHWYRFVLNEYIQGKANVYLVDRCRSEYVDPNNIRNIAKHIVDLPILVFAAQFGGYNAIIEGPEAFELIDFIAQSKEIVATSLSLQSDSTCIHTIQVEELEQQQE